MTNNEVHRRDLESKGWTLRPSGLSWTHQDPMFTCGRCARNRLQCIVPHISRTRLYEEENEVYCLSKCLACRTANTVGGCSLAGTNGAKVKYHWSDKDGWTRTTRGWRRVISDLLGSNSKERSAKLKKEEVVESEGHKARPDHACGTLVQQGEAGDGRQVIASDARPHAAYLQKGQHGDQPRQRSHPTSPASPPDMVEPVSRLPSSDPFADSNENKELYRNFGPSFSDIRYITPRVRKHRHPPKNDFCERDRWSPPMMLSTELLNDHRRISPTFDGARQLSYGSMPIPEDLPSPPIRLEPSASIRGRIEGRATYQGSLIQLYDALPSPGLEPEDSTMHRLADRLRNLGRTRRDQPLTREPNRAAQQWTFSESVEQERATGSENIAEDGTSVP